MSKASMQLAQKYGLSVTPAGPGYGHTVHGDILGFSASVTAYRSENLLVHAVKISGNFHDEALRQKLMPALEAIRSNKLVKEVSIDNSISIVAAKVMTEIKFEELEGFFIKLHGALDGSTVTPACENCGAQESLSLIQLSTRADAINTCNNCSQGILSEISSTNAAADARSNNYGMGILGALLFALAGVALWVIIAMFDFIAGIAGYAISYLAYLGYKKAGGKVNRTAVVIIVIMSLLLVLVSTYLSLSIIIAREGVTFLDAFLGLPLVMAEYPDLAAEFLKILGIGVLFTLAASYQLFRNMAREGSKATARIIRQPNV